MLTNRDRQPVPGPLCATFAPLLPALDDLTNIRLAEDTRAHLAECAWCRAQRATYDRFDEALRLHFAPDAMPVLSENLAANLLGDAFSETRGNVATLAPTDMKSAQDDELEGEHDEALHITITPLPISPHAPRRLMRLTTSAATLAAVLVISLLAGLLFLAHGRPTTPASTVTPHATATAIPGSQTALAAIGMSSATDGWAFAHNGSGMNEGPNTSLHYTGGRWVEVQTGINANIEVVKMVSANDGWAIGSAVYHYDGTHWRQVNVNLPESPSLSVDAIDVIAPNNIWLAGMYRDDQGLILHYDGYLWMPQRIPALANMGMVNITGIAMISADEGWAVGTATGYADNNGNSSQTGLVLHYSKGAWQLTQTIPHSDLRTIAMGSATDGWFGGEKQERNTQFPAIGPTWEKPTLWRYSDGRWAEVAVPLPANAGGVAPAGQIANVTMFSATNGWMIASLQDTPQSLDGSATLTPDVFHLEQGRWTQIASPVVQQRRYAFMSQVAFLSPDEFWGVGVTSLPGDSTTVTPLIVHYKYGVWTVVAD